MNKRALFAALALLPLFAQAEIKTIKDVLGREVKVDVPVKRAVLAFYYPCLLYTSPSPRDVEESRMPSSA